MPGPVPDRHAELPRHAWPNDPWPGLVSDDGVPDEGLPDGGVPDDGVCDDGLGDERLPGDIRSSGVDVGIEASAASQTVEDLGLEDAWPKTCWPDVIGGSIVEAERGEAPVSDDESGPAATSDSGMAPASDETAHQRDRRWRSRFARPHLVIVSVIVVIGICLAGWAVLRVRPIALAAPHKGSSASTDSASPADSSTARPSSSTAAPAGPASAGESTSPPTIKVHVTGAIKKPGVLRLRKGDLVEDALDKAGGTARRADLGELNLAQPLRDGQQLVVTKRSAKSDEKSGLHDPSDGGSQEPGAPSGGDDDTSADQSDSTGPKSKINLNDASKSQLEELSGIGPATADKIVEWRKQNGRFTTIKELQEVGGIGPKRSADLAPHITVS